MKDDTFASLTLLIGVMIAIGVAVFPHHEDGTMELSGEPVTEIDFNADTSDFHMRVAPEEMYEIYEYTPPPSDGMCICPSVSGVPCKCFRKVRGE